MEKIKEGYTRVTTIVQAFEDLSHIPKEVLDNAGERGTRVHQSCDSIVFGMEFDDYPDSDRWYIESFKKWYTHKYFLPKQERFYCDDLMITGEADMLYSDPERGIVLVDLKTSAKESKSWPIQGAGYVYLAEKNTNLEINEIEFVKLSKTGSKPIIYNYKIDIPLFMACHKVYKTFYQNKDLIDVSEYI